MAFKSAILLAGCLSATAAATKQKPSQSRFLRNRKRHDARRGAAINEKLHQDPKSSSPQHQLDITAEDVGFWTRSLQSSFTPLPTPPPTRRSTNNPIAPSPVSTPFPTDVPETPGPTPNPTAVPETSGPTPNPTPGPTPNPTPGPTPNPTPEPTPNPTPEPTPNPTPEPTPNPTPGPTPSPTPEPTPLELVPTPSPTTTAPTFIPTASPTFPCNLTPDERADEIRELLSTISEPSLFDDPDTPQAKALDWITNDDAIEPILCPNEAGDGCTRGGTVNPLVQRYVVATFYFATEGDDWNKCTAADDFDDEGSVGDANDNCDRIVTPFGVGNDRVGDTSTDAWLGPVNECEWGGIACWGEDTANLNLCIDQLDFESDGLSGVLAKEIGNLEVLRFLILERGTISGPIPTEFGDLERLLILDMDFNDLSGEIPDELFGLKSLQQLDLNDNEITGTLSSRVGELKFLTFLQLDHNLLSDTIPSEIGNLENLRIAFLSENDFTGEMPDEVCALRNNTSPPGVLGVLVTDCQGNDPEVICPCCSSCA